LDYEIVKETYRPLNYVCYEDATEENPYPYTVDGYGYWTLEGAESARADDGIITADTSILQLNASSKENTSTIQLKLTRAFSSVKDTISDVSAISTVGIKYITNYQFNGNTDSKEDLSKDNKDNIVDALLKDKGSGASTTGAFKKDGNATLNLIVGGYEDSYVYVLGYATVSKDSNSYTLYTGLQAVTYNNLKKQTTTD
jgi:hypothetical protein